MADITSPDGLEQNSKQPTTREKNRPRSNRILVIVVVSFVAVLLLILLNIDTNREPRNNKGDKNIKASQIIAADPGGLTFERSDERSTTGPTVGEPEKEAVDDDDLILLPDGTIGKKGQITATPRTQNIKIVQKAPSEGYRKSRELLLAALHATSDVAFREDGLKQDSDAPKTPYPESVVGGAQSRQNVDVIRNQILSGRSMSGFYNPDDLGVDTNAVAMAHQDRNVGYVQSQQGGGNAAAIKSEYNPNTRRSGISEYELKAGTVIQGVLTSGINSDLPGTVLGQVVTHVWDTATGAHKLIPQGSRLVGEYDSHVVYGQNRVLVVWKRVIYPDGTSLNLEGLIGTDRSGYSGFKEKIDNHYSRMVGAALLASVFVATGKIATEDDKNKDDDESRAAEAVMEQMTSLGAKLVERNMNVAPTLRILPGYQFSIITTKDIAFAEPY